MNCTRKKSPSPIQALVAVTHRCCGGQASRLAQVRSLKSCACSLFLSALPGTWWCFSAFPVIRGLACHLLKHCAAHQTSSCWGSVESSVESSIVEQRPSAVDVASGPTLFVWTKHDTCCAGCPPQHCLGYATFHPYHGMSASLKRGWCLTVDRVLDDLSLVLLGPTRRWDVCQ